MEVTTGPIVAEGATPRWHLVVAGRGGSLRIADGVPNVAGSFCQLHIVELNKVTCIESRCLLTAAMQGDGCACGPGPVSGLLTCFGVSGPAKGHWLIVPMGLFVVPMESTLDAVIQHG